jgi:hypothetical protein
MRKYTIIDNFDKFSVYSTLQDAGKDYSGNKVDKGPGEPKTWAGTYPYQQTSPQLPVMRYIELVYESGGYYTSPDMPHYSFKGGNFQGHGLTFAPMPTTLPGPGAWENNPDLHSLMPDIFRYTTGRRFYIDKNKYLRYFYNDHPHPEALHASHMWDPSEGLHEQKDDLMAHNYAKSNFYCDILNIQNEIQSNCNHFNNDLTFDDYFNPSKFLGASPELKEQFINVIDQVYPLGTIGGVPMPPDLPWKESGFWYTLAGAAPILEPIRNKLLFVPHFPPWSKAEDYWANINDFALISLFDRNLYDWGPGSDGDISYLQAMVRFINHYYPDGWGDAANGSINEVIQTLLGSSWADSLFEIDNGIPDDPESTAAAVNRKLFHHIYFVTDFFKATSANLSLLPGDKTVAIEPNYNFYFELAEDLPPNVITEWQLPNIYTFSQLKNSVDLYGQFSTTRDYYLQLITLGQGSDISTGANFSVGDYYNIIRNTEVVPPAHWEAFWGAPWTAADWDSLTEGMTPYRYNTVILSPDTLNVDEASLKCFPMYNKITIQQPALAEQLATNAHIVYSPERLSDRLDKSYGLDIAGGFVHPKYKQKTNSFGYGAFLSVVANYFTRATQKESLVHTFAMHVNPNQIGTLFDAGLGGDIIGD